MLIPFSWLKEFVEIPADVGAQQIADIFTRIGFEEEGIEYFGQDLRGPLVVGRVVEFVEEPQSNGKTVRWCQVEVAPGEITGIVCGARNFFENDKVVVVRPGATLPGGFEIAARKTYGHVSDGMICSGRELQFSDDHGGIIRLAELGLDPEVGVDAIELLGLRDAVIDISVLPDRGYALSMRGAARELAAATGWAWKDPADIDGSLKNHPDAVAGEIKDTSACSRLVLRTLDGFNPAAVSPVWMQRRLFLAGMRPISLAVDVTNYVMLELGQPLHAYDRNKVQGPIVVERAGKHCSLKTLDEAERNLSPTEVLIADNSGPIGLAGVMGGFSTEMDSTSTAIVLEAARFNPADIAKASRKHKLISEASRRFERSVDPELAPVASARAASLLKEFGGAVELGGVDITYHVAAAPVTFSKNFPNQYLGTDFTQTEIQSALIAVGCDVLISESDFIVTAPSWRADLKHKVDFLEEIARILGYDRIPSIQPPTNAGMGFTVEQKFRRKVARLLAEAGLVEVLSYPFVGDVDFNQMLLDETDSRRDTIKLANPLSAEAPSMRTTLLPPLLNTAKRNVGRGFNNVAVFEIGKVVLPDGEIKVAPQPDISTRPSDEILLAIDAAVPAQPIYLAAVLAGEIEIGQPVFANTQNWDWQNTLAMLGRVISAAGLVWRAEQLEMAPWHPGRAAGIVVNNMMIGFAGELHPNVCKNFGLPARTCAFEIDLDALAGAGLDPKSASPVRTMPRANLDFAFVVDREIPAMAVAKVLSALAQELVESVEVFDIYEGEQIPLDKKSVAVALTLRAIDRTLSDVELTEIRAGLIAEVENKLGAVLR